MFEEVSSFSNDVVNSIAATAEMLDTVLFFEDLRSFAVELLECVLLFNLN